MKNIKIIFLSLVAGAGIASCSEDNLSEEELKAARETLERNYTNPKNMYLWGNTSPWNSMYYWHTAKPVKFGKSMIFEEKQELEKRFSEEFKEL
ncbi:MAG: hypothetical protein MUW56_12480 [Chryseobacterium sp.]|uniref:hypothetical protein n=1 Tax=Chryseobacterium sp. TaxID=1871047 RepID=UPI0025C36C43|nr:hypothetical protein [Chryseobacterium sp.]MCJ7934420.1 hypothetical protein [Chryseobacterium sp.]